MTDSLRTSDIFVRSQAIYNGPSTSNVSTSQWDGSRNSIQDAVSLDSHRPLSSFVNLLQFLGTTNVKILDPDDIERDTVDSDSKRGASMQVYRGHYNDKPAALKYFRWPSLDALQPQQLREVLSRYQQVMYDLLFELKVMTHEPLCHHRNIVRAFGVTFDPKVGNITDPSLTDLINPIVVVELADPRHPDLAELFRVTPEKNFTFEFLANLISDIADGIAILHEYGLVHSDIKPANILIFSEENTLVAKIGDFGAAGLEATKDKPRGFTKYWGAPECLEECPLPELRQAGFGKPSDVYSFGLVMGFIMLLGQNPIPDMPKQAALKFDDVIDDVVFDLINDLWSGKDDVSMEEHEQVRTRLGSIHRIVGETLRLQPNARTTGLGDVRRQLLGSDPFAVEKHRHKFIKRQFAERERSVIGSVKRRGTYDTLDVSPKYGIYPSLPGFLLPLLTKAGIAEPESVKYYPRGVLKDQPIVVLGDKENALRKVSKDFEDLDDTLEEIWNSWMQEAKTRTGRTAALDESLEYENGCERFRQVTGFSETIRHYAVDLMKMRICPELYPLGQYTRVRYAMKHHSDPAIFNIRDPRFDNKTLLHASCYYRDLEMARFLIENGADIDAVDANGYTPWLQAFLQPCRFLRVPGLPWMARSKDIPAYVTIEVAQFLVSQGARLNFELNGCPLLNRLHILQHSNADKPELIDFLIRHGHPVDSYHPVLGSPLSCAAIFRHVNSTRRLLRLGANPSINRPARATKNPEGLTSTQAALLQDFRTQSVIEYVVMDAVKSQQDQKGLEIFQLLLEHGAVVYPRQGQIGWDHGSPMAHVFILKRRSDLLRVLLKHRPEFVLTRNAGGLTPLHIAAWIRDLPSVQLLIDHGADVNARSADGLTPIMSAFTHRFDLDIESQDSPEFQKQSLEIAHVLSANGADTTARRSWQFAPPSRLYLDANMEDVSRSCAFTAADDSFVNNWKSWLLRRNLDTKLATCGSALFLKPTIIGSGASTELIVPIFGNNSSRALQGLYRLNVRLGVLECRHNDMAVGFLMERMKNEPSDTTDPDRANGDLIGIADLNELRPDHAYEMQFETPIEVGDSTGYIFVGLIAAHEGQEIPAAGLVLDWLELSPISGDDKVVLEGDEEWSLSPSINKSCSIAGLTPRGIWKALSEEPVTREHNNDNLRKFALLDMEDLARFKS